MKKNTLLFIIVFLSGLIQVQAQEFSKFDFGRMWTFEDAPLDYFNSTYDLDLDQAWMDKVRKSALRFSTFCSASFVSDQGLIMTNHHCSRGLIPPLQKNDEDLLKYGFYAQNQEDERKAEGLFVDQLIRAKDITAELKNLQNNLSEKEAQDSLTSLYEEKPEWKDLRLQLVTYYSGGRYAIYGYKRYSDIRLVLLPENDLGYFGGDPDNFTYPRYNLDFTFWRAYDDQGNPLNTADFYFPFNPDGTAEGTPVFVVGNPGRTERYRTMTQLEYDRNVRLPAVLSFIKSGIRALEHQMETNPSAETENAIFSLKNGEKAYTGMLGGLNNEVYMARKKAAENKIRAATEDQFTAENNPWEQIDAIYQKLTPYGGFSTLLNASPYRGVVTRLLHKIYDYMSNENDSEVTSIAAEIKTLAPQATDDDQEIYLQGLIDDYNKFSDDAISQDKASVILDNTLFRDSDQIEDWLKWDKNAQQEDPLAALSVQLMSDYERSVELSQQYGKEIQGYNEDIALAAFQVFGNQLPPDATFTLRISDGLVQGYAYNGTVAPVNTTYFGLYNRYYSHQKEFPWELPQAWLNPSMDLLKTPLNFISTNDIIGGNSGSAVINAQGEAVGLAFDGNIQSLPGNFIFDDAVNRTVSVHSGGIVGAMRHIYRAKRLLRELKVEH